MNDHHSKKTLGYTMRLGCAQDHGALSLHAIGGREDGVTRLGIGGDEENLAGHTSLRAQQATLAPLQGPSRGPAPHVGCGPVDRRHPCVAKETRGSWACEGARAASTAHEERGSHRVRRRSVCRWPGVSKGLTRCSGAWQAKPLALAHQARNGKVKHWIVTGHWPRCLANGRREVGPSARLP